MWDDVGVPVGGGVVAVPVEVAERVKEVPGRPTHVSVALRPVGPVPDVEGTEGSRLSSPPRARWDGTGTLSLPTADDRVDGVWCGSDPLSGSGCRPGTPAPSGRSPTTRVEPGLLCRSSGGHDPTGGVCRTPAGRGAGTSGPGPTRRLTPRRTGFLPVPVVPVEPTSRESGHPRRWTMVTLSPRVSVDGVGWDRPSTRRSRVLTHPRGGRVGGTFPLPRS